jgi:hypothetical protein
VGKFCFAQDKLCDLDYSVSPLPREIWAMSEASYDSKYHKRQIRAHQNGVRKRQNKKRENEIGKDYECLSCPFTRWEIKKNLDN